MTTLHRRLFYVLLVTYLLLGLAYSIATPPFEASDELWHYPTVKYLADNGLQLPPQDPTNPGPWRQEGSQPPLYYILSAILTAPIDTSDMEVIRRINPHADIGIIRPDGSVNMIVHRADAEAFPWRGTMLALQITRIFSVLLGLGTVWVTHQLAREIFPETPLIALGAAALTAFLPMFLFISGSVNNDNLSNLLGNLLTLQIVWLLKARQPPRWRAYIALGLVAGAGLLAKLNIGFLIPLVGLALLIVTLRLRNWRPFILGGLTSGAIAITVAGWWYLRNMQLYGDPSGINRFLEMVGRRAVPANVAQLWSERHSFTQAYWGFFGGVNVPLPEPIYLIFNIIGGLALLSAAVFLLHTLLRQRWSLDRWLPALITILWPAITFVSFLRWTAETPASQGRLLFGALSSIALWMAAGLVVWLPPRWKAIILTPTVGWFTAIAILSPFLAITPAYQPPAPTTQEPMSPWAVFIDGRGGSIAVGLASSEIGTPSISIQPETYVTVDVLLEIRSPLDQDWSLFVHLVTPDGVIIGQRDVYPGGGKLATSDLQPGFRWKNPIAVWVPTAAYAPMPLDIVLGWYDLRTGERLRLEDGQETVSLGQVQLEPRVDDLGLPNPIRINFDNQIELVGYSLSDLSPQPGDTVELTLYWRGLRQVDVDYKIFANIIDPSTLTKYAASDGMPVNWQAPTSTWIPGTVIQDVRPLIVSTDAPPGIYELELGIYQEKLSGSIERLRIVTPDGGMSDNFIYLSRVRIIPKESP
jgi:4-amino-4-deoxy-L-arabinose transferase-like glycosyltransferase